MLSLVLLCHKTGVREGGVFSPFLFGIVIDNLVKLVNKANVRCRIRINCTTHSYIMITLFCWHHLFMHCTAVVSIF